MVMACVESQRAASTNERVAAVTRRLLALVPAVLPMDTWAKFLQAVHDVLYTGGRDGSLACESTVHAFCNAINDWHVEWGHHGPDLSAPPYKPILKGIINGRVVVPKNAAYKADARHGHEAMPYAVWRRCVDYCDGLLKENKPWFRIGLRRDSVLLRLLFVQCRRQDELWQAQRESFLDLGIGKGFSWVIMTMKNRQRLRTVVPIVESTGDGVAVGAHLRSFLAVAPIDGRLFRRTANVLGSNSVRSWEPAYKEIVQTDKYGEQRPVVVEQGFGSGEWNDSLRSIVASACPEVDARLYTAHCLRGGGAATASANDVPVTMVRQMLAHRRLDSTMVYIRPGEGSLRQAFASVCAPRSALGGR
jgi:hypothetical protein